MNKPRIYAAFTGLGKTWFCQHYPGWVDIDESIFAQCQTYDCFVAAYVNYTKWGYHILTTAQPITLNGLDTGTEKFDVIVILPKPGLKDVILQRVANRDTEDYWHDLLCKQWDIRWEMIHNHPLFKYMYIDENTYISDILLPNGEFTELGQKIYNQYNPAN